ncbi:MAG: hypothetical protein ACRDKW_04170, partial [Actinomycetota bacterium]
SRARAACTSAAPGWSPPWHPPGRRRRGPGMRVRWLVIAILIVALVPRQVVGFSQAVTSTVVGLVDQMLGASR